MNNEIVIYQDNQNFLRLEVRVENETVWLTQAQMSDLFDTTRNNITLHISNIFKEKELDKNLVCKDSLLTAADGKKYKTMFYNLDVIISVGYRVKSIRGTQFRVWANSVLKEHLLKGYSLNKRMNRLEDNMDSLTKRVSEIDLQININLPPRQGIFFNGEIFDSYIFVTDLIKKAKKSIILIDNYIDESVLMMLAKRNKNVSASVYTKSISRQLKLDLNKHNQQYPKIDIKTLSKSHDRFLIIDKKELFHFGASLKDLGKKWFAFSKMDDFIDDVLNKLDENSDD